MTRILLDLTLHFMPILFILILTINIHIFMPQLFLIFHFMSAKDIVTIRGLQIDEILNNIFPLKYLAQLGM